MMLAIRNWRTYFCQWCIDFCENRQAGADEIDWAAFLRDALALFKKIGLSYYIKKDLAAFGEGML